MGPTERTRWELDTPLSVEAVTGALVDFSPRREVIWKETCDPAVYRIHAVGDTWAEVTEGVSYAWSRERYDWSIPGVVTLTPSSRRASPSRSAPSGTRSARSPMAAHGSSASATGSFAGLAGGCWAPSWCSSGRES